MTDCGSVPRRLLLIDDDPSLRTTVGCLLRKFGHTVEVAESGSAGLALLRQKPVDLVLTDLKMPGLTGWDVARLVKATHPRLPVVLVTGCAQTIPPDKPERSWVDAILAKPCGAAAMLAVIGALTRDLADVSCSGGPEKPVRTTVRGRPMGAPAAGDVEQAAVDVHGPSMPRYHPGAELA